MSKTLLALLLLLALPLQAAQRAPTKAAAPPPPDEEAATVSRMSVDEKLAQLFMVSWPGYGLPETWRAALAAGEVSAIALRPGENYLLPDELDALTAEARAANGAPHPLLFAAPCEGGLRALLHPAMGGAAVPEAAALGARGDANAVQAAYARLAADFAAHGIHLALGPVLGYTALNPDFSTDARAFGSSPESVRNLVRAAVSGIREGGAICTPVEYPALDALTKGRVLDLDAVNDRLEMVRVALEAGAGGMAVSTIRVPAWDKEAPAGLSGAAVRETLQGQLGFGGLVISPDVASPEATMEYGAERTSALALRAGCDMLMLRTADPEELRLRMQQVKSALDSGTLAMGRVDEAVRRILLTKRRARAANPPAAPEEAPPSEPVPNGVVVVRDEPHMLPLRAVGARYLVVSPEADWKTPQGEEVLVGTTLGAAVRGVVKDAVEVRFNLTPTAPQRANAIREAGQADILIVGTLLPKFYTAQRQLVDELLSLGKPTVIVQLGDASELEAFANSHVLLCANGYSPPALEAAARVLFGEERAGGRLTAPIGRLFPAGHAGP